MLEEMCAPQVSGRVGWGRVGWQRAEVLDAQARPSMAFFLLPADLDIEVRSFSGTMSAACHHASHGLFISPTLCRKRR